jgi:hypothetical protein
MPLNRNLLGCGDEGASEAELFDLPDKATGLSRGQSAEEVAGAEVSEEGSVAQHVIDGCQELSRFQRVDLHLSLRFAVSTDSRVSGNDRESPITASEEQRGALTALAGSRDRGEADKARAVLLNTGRLDQPTHRRGVRGARRHGPTLAERFRPWRR